MSTMHSWHLRPLNKSRDKQNMKNQVYEAQSAFQAIVSAVAFLLMDRFDDLLDMGVIPDHVHEVVYSYEQNTNWGCVQLSSGCLVLYKQVVPANQMAMAGVVFDANRMGNVWYFTCAG